LKAIKQCSITPRSSLPASDKQEKQIDLFFKKYYPNTPIGIINEFKSNLKNQLEEKANTLFEKSYNCSNHAYNRIMREINKINQKITNNEYFLRNIKTKEIEYLFIAYIRHNYTNYDSLWSDDDNSFFLDEAKKTAIKTQKRQQVRENIDRLLSSYS
jgi:hypothetical protein